MNIPEKMKALVLENYNANLIRALQSMKLVELPMPKLATNQVLVKVEASPINPSDIAFLRGGYNIVKPLPAIPGFEGVGKIVELGSDMDASLLGKRVVFFIQSNKSGAWSEYAVVGNSDFIPVSRDLPVDQAACLFVNPFTAYALFEHIRENQHEAIVQSAALSQLGQFIRYFAGRQNLSVINLVRKPEQVQQLKSEGCVHVLDINHEDFDAKFKAMAELLNATIAIDAVGGELTGKMFNAMPSGSEILLYGGLSGMPVSGINPLDLIFKNKVLSGFNLNDWLAEKSEVEFGEISTYIQKLFMEGELLTKIHQTVPFGDFYSGFRAYIANMSAGKVLLSFD